MWPNEYKEKEELAEFNKKYPYRKYNISDKEQLLPVYKDLIKKNSKYLTIAIDGRPLEVGDINNTGNFAINGEQFMANNVFYFPVAMYGR